MDREELILIKLQKIQLNNEIAHLETDLRNQAKTNKQLTDKSKQMIAELVKANSILIHEKSSLEKQILLLQHSINKIPKFIIKFFLGKNTKLLDKGENMYE